MDKLRSVLAVGLFAVACITAATLARDLLRIAAETHAIQVQAALVEAETERTEAETSRRSQQAMENITLAALAEAQAAKAWAERERERADRLQVEQYRLALETAQGQHERNKQREKWTSLVVATIAVVVAAVVLSRRYRYVVILPLSPGAQIPWLPIDSSSDLVFREEQYSTMQVTRDGYQEIAIE
jgi:uncharacterized membrane protein YqiK